MLLFQQLLAGAGAHQSNLRGAVEQFLLTLLRHAAQTVIVRPVLGHFIEGRPRMDLDFHPAFRAGLISDALEIGTNGQRAAIRRFEIETR